MSSAAPTRADRWVMAGATLAPQRLIDFRTDGQPAAILVVVPCFNSEAWIDGCLKALATNDERHDILLVDDGERPIEPHVAPQPNLAILRFDRKIGLIGALNAAAVFAREQGYTYYVRQDTDDIPYPARLRRQRETLESTGADLVVSPVRVVDVEGRVLWLHGISGVMRDPVAAMHARNPFVHSTFFMRTDLFTKAGAYDPCFKHAEDFELLQRIVRRGKIVATDEVLLDYTSHVGSALSQSKGPAIATVKVLLAYFDPTRLVCYIGLLRSLTILMTPRSAKTWLRRVILGGRREVG